MVALSFTAPFDPSPTLARRSRRLQICDEAHRCTGRRTKRDAQPLSDGFLRASRRLFLTATPRLLGAKRDKEGELMAVGSMDDVQLFGRVVYRLAYSDAVARRIVAPLKLVFLDLTKLVEEYGLAPPPASSLVALGDAGGGGVASRELAELSAAMLDCHRRHGVRTAFCFCSNNERARELERVARSSLAAHGVALGRVSGRMNAPARAQVLDPVRRAASTPLPAEPTNGSMAIVTNCRVLGEGVDLPAVDLVVFADAKQRCVCGEPHRLPHHCASTHPASVCACACSHVDILQCMGRASRRSLGKEFGHVLVPMSEEDSSAYETAVSVVRAYAEQDEEFKAISPDLPRPSPLPSPQPEPYSSPSPGVQGGSGVPGGRGGAPGAAAPTGGVARGAAGGDRAAGRRDERAADGGGAAGGDGGGGARGPVGGMKHHAMVFLLE